jgi:hypothetical protein
MVTQRRGTPHKVISKTTPEMRDSDKNKSSGGGNKRINKNSNLSRVCGCALAVAVSIVAVSAIFRRSPLSADDELLRVVPRGGDDDDETQCKLGPLVLEYLVRPLHVVRRMYSHSL